ncbi:hypothetical protein P153DRAFT_361614 [Dothidotthia symphoricarpi CBS 119687]|uniref:RRM domain-containing protein n=1 Tax=Dothidotthia symphoricarpi CBS 119687 TaxID=1392245 RepID=A0A6A5ZZX2_9PLEO|nr:uncharacterized protein P153DRAFT_361614 [Dothidotthia symphoricarpi CBS 119687]KAF2123988.1 hypothetical protein P153DRAFT_361614 [Dothidotthia symphoricarpi CBS 119687]
MAPTKNHLIFVKNVPSDTARKAIPRLYAQYGAVEYTNIYAASSITTVMIGFQTMQEAVYAQQDTDGMKLDNVILRVERYHKKQSVRFLRERRRAGGLLGDEGGDYEDEGADIHEEPGMTPEVIPPPVKPVALPVRKVAPANGSWARVAAGSGPLGVVYASTARCELSSKAPVVVDFSTAATSIGTVVASDVGSAVATGSRHSKSISITRKSAHTNFHDRSSASDVLFDANEIDAGDAAGEESVHFPEDTNQTQDVRERTNTSEPRVSDTGNRLEQWGMLAWPVDTTEYIQQRHSESCSFCQMRRR